MGVSQYPCFFFEKHEDKTKIKMLSAAILIRTLGLILLIAAGVIELVIVLTIIA